MSDPNCMPPCIGYKYCSQYRAMGISTECYYEWKKMCRLHSELYKQVYESKPFVVKN